MLYGDWMHMEDFSPCYGSIAHPSSEKCYEHVQNVQMYIILRVWSFFWQVIFPLLQYFLQSPNDSVSNNEGHIIQCECTAWSMPSLYADASKTHTVYDSTAYCLETDPDCATRKFPLFNTAILKLCTSNSKEVWQECANRRLVSNYSYMDRVCTKVSLWHMRTVKGQSSLRNQTILSGSFGVCVSLLFVLRFYGPVNPTESCRARSVYLTTHLLGRLSPLSG